jgi:TonB system transport protein ExbD (group 1)
VTIQLGGDGLRIKRHSYQQNAEMNVTPFVDVILVLLIIFMVAAPLATVNVPVDLPRNSTSPKPPPVEPIYISVQKDGSVFLQNDPTNLSDLPRGLEAQTLGNRETRIFLRSDQHAEYGKLMAVVNVLQSGGYSKIGLVAEEEQSR